jgi:hypothetical protein
MSLTLSSKRPDQRLSIKYEECRANSESCGRAMKKKREEWVVVGDTTGGRNRIYNRF